MEFAIVAQLFRLILKWAKANQIENFTLIFSAIKEYKICDRRENVISSNGKLKRNASK
jgi:hypothetical protein